MMKSSRDDQRPRQPRHTNVPIALDRFIGRQHDVAQLVQLFASAHLVTLTGPGGCGKTRLAQHVAGELAAKFTDGVYWVELGRLTDPVLVPLAVAKVANIAEQADQPLMEQLFDGLAGRQILLVLDNCEHLVGVCAQLVQSLGRLPQIAILATSREPLNVPGERQYLVQTLSVPPDSATPAELERYESVQLFVDRARAVLPGFAVTSANAAYLARICHQLDGLPLALELASARVNVLTLQEMEARLADRFGWLVSRLEGVEARQRTLRSTIDWSYEALSDLEQRVLQQLSLFAGGCHLEAAEALWALAAPADGRLLDTLSTLVAKSLVLADTLQVSQSRYRLLETIRHYVQAKLLAVGQWSVAHDHYLHYYAGWMEKIAPKLNGHEQPIWLSRVEDESDNLRSALTWSLQSRQIETGLRLANALLGFWLMHSHLVEGYLWLERLLAQAGDDLPLALHVKALTAAALIAGRRNDALGAQGHAQRAVALCEAAGEAGKPPLVEALAGLAISVQAIGDFLTAYQLVEQTIPLCRELGDAHLLGMFLRVGGVAATGLGQYEAARTMLNEALALARGAGVPYWTALALTYLGDLARCEQDFDGARLAYEESVVWLREVGVGRDVAGALHSLAHACLHLDEVERAAELFRESLTAQQALENASGVAECLLGFAALAVCTGLPGIGARLLAAAEIVRPAPTTVWPAERLEQEYYLARIRAELSASEFEIETGRGHSLSIEEAIQDALALRVRPAVPTSRPMDGLSRRERDIAALVARGQSNSEIAAQLVLSKRTVEKHIGNILSKLGFSSRAQIVRWALENDLA